MATLTSCRSAAVRSGTRLYTWLLSAIGGSASSNRPRGNSPTSSVTAARADPGWGDLVTGRRIEGGKETIMGGAALSTSKVTRGEASAAGVLSLALGLSWLPASPLKGSASAGPRSRPLFSPSVSRTRRCLFRLMSLDLVEPGNGWVLRKRPQKQRLPARSSDASGDQLASVSWTTR